METFWRVMVSQFEGNEVTRGVGATLLDMVVEAPSPDKAVMFVFGSVELAAAGVSSLLVLAEGAYHVSVRRTTRPAEYPE